mmetsp:Transcript_27875/g.46852  ORF Transcript_27875/g.46852 Transcript_27875/m.46852 type:complete len:332 (+) Transcript_27875:1093-2088(+)
MPTASASVGTESHSFFSPATARQMKALVREEDGSISCASQLLQPELSSWLSLSTSHLRDAAEGYIALRDICQQSSLFGSSTSSTSSSSLPAATMITSDTTTPATAVATGGGEVDMDALREILESPNHCSNNDNNDNSEGGMMMHAARSSRRECILRSLKQRIPSNAASVAEVELLHRLMHIAPTPAITGTGGGGSSITSKNGSKLSIDASAIDAAGSSAGSKQTAGINTPASGENSPLAFTTTTTKMNSSISAGSISTGNSHNNNSNTNIPRSSANGSTNTATSSNDNNNTSSLHIGSSSSSAVSSVTTGLSPAAQSFLQQLPDLKFVLCE